MFSIMAQNRRRGWQNFEKKTGEALAETVFSRNFVTLGADFEGHNWKHDLARLCFMLYTPSYGNSQLKMEILEFTSKEAAAPLMSLAAPLWFWKFREKNSEFGNFFPKFWKFENFQNFELKFPKSEANFDAERGIWEKKCGSCLRGLK